MNYGYHDLPDAPWIRDAERNGYPSTEPVYCPICGKECTTIYKDINSEVFACNWCLEEQDADEWQAQEKESSRPDWADE